MPDRISAYIPTYNRHELLLERALASVLRQTHPVDEIIIVADGEEPESFQGLWNDPRIQRISAPRGDPSLHLYNIDRPAYPEWPGDVWLIKGYAARNHALDVATGDWIAPLDDDDEWTDNHIEVLLEAALRKNVQFAYGKALTDHGQWYGSWPASGANFTDGSQLYRHDLGYRYDPECISRGKAADQDIWDRMVVGGVTFAFVDRLVHRYYPAQ